MDDLEIKKHLEKIINSHTFSLSDVYKRLLKYLTEATLRDEKPKEYTIGVDVFNLNSDSPATSKVRVSVHNLRKKLSTYYETEGIHDAIIFSIPKGTYSLVFKNRHSHLFNTRIQKYWLIALLFILVMLSLVLILLIKPHNGKLEKTKFWNELIRNKKETVIVVGDAFLFTENSLSNKYGTYCNIYSNLINSEQDLQQFINNSDSLRLKDFKVLTNATLVSRSALYSLPGIIPVLDRNNIKYKIILSSNFRWETYNDYNIIYIGAIKNMRYLSYLTKYKLNIDFQPATNTLTLTDKGTERSFTSFFDKNITTDYTLVSKIPGPSSNVFYLFCSNFEIGCMESVKYFTQSDSVQSFGKTILKDANYFSAVFKAEGVERINITFNLVDYKPIKDSAMVNFWHY